MKFLFITVLLFITVSLLSQDTLNVMHYNLLYYGVNNGTCNQTSNSYQVKNQNLRILMNYFTPDILTLNEISPNVTYHQSLLTNVLNTDGRTFYKLAPISNYSGSNIINLVAYNSAKIEVSKMFSLTTGIRDINIYKMFYKYADLGLTGDSIFLYVVVAHLKAGTATADKAQRAVETQTLMEFLQSQNIYGNVTFSGDFNLTGSSEEAYQNLISWPQPDFRFVDPVDAPGNWSNNSAFSHVHTQSSREEPYGCGATGGLDDRFDFILASMELMNGSQQVTYINNSFKTIGQDGLHYNKSVNFLPNASAPVEVLNALYEISDHLPVVMKLKVEFDEFLFHPDLIISEYIEGSNNNKALELYNPTALPVQLSQYQLARYANGSFDPDTVSLAGVLNPYQTYVVVLDKRDPNGVGFETPVDPELQAKADTFLCPVYDINKTMYFNGDDAMAIIKKSNGSLVDLIGKIGQDPGNGWTIDSLCYAPFTTLCGAEQWTAEHTLVRKFEVKAGVLSNPEVFRVNSEWDQFPANDFAHLNNHESLAHPEIPIGFTFTRTSRSHIIAVQLSVHPMINNVELEPGDYIGLFFKDGPEEKCGGSVVWTGSENTAVVAFGDESLTAVKDGFLVNENIIWKVYSRNNGTTYYAKSTFDSLYPQYTGKFTPFGLSALKTMKAFDTRTFNVELAAGWSGISSYIIPADKKLENLFQSVTSDLELLQHPSGIYWPSQNTNTLVDWDNQKGYLVKMNTAKILPFTGIIEPDPEFDFITGWNFFPVLTSCGIDAVFLNTQIDGMVEIALEMAGSKIYWPAMNINTIGTFQPGKAYYIKTSGNKKLVYPVCR